MADTTQEIPATRAAKESSGFALPGKPLGIAWGFLYGHNGVPAAEFLPDVRELGGGFSKVYLFWEQLEPNRGEYDFSDLDAYLDQLEEPEEGLVSIFSASTWATEVPSDMLPPSPAKNLDDYYQMVHAAVTHAQGKVRYWQNDCEPTNPIYWAGTKEQFVAQLETFHRAVKDADPEAIVVIGGYDGLFDPDGPRGFPGQAEHLAFFDYVMREAAAHYDVFDLRLYANPYTIERRVQVIRSMLAAAGSEKPIICTEYNGPGFFEFPANRAYFNLIAEWGAMAGMADGEEREAAYAAMQQKIGNLYDQMETLAPQTQMFLQGCSPELESKLRRIQSRDIVYRNLFALSSGVEKTLYWDFYHDTSARNDMMTIMYGKLTFMEATAAGFVSCNPTTEAFRRLATEIQGMQSVVREAVEADPTIMLFRVRFVNRPELLIAWQQRDAFGGEAEPPVVVTLPVSQPVASATTLFGDAVATEFQGRELSLEMTDTPVFIRLASDEDGSS